MKRGRSAQFALVFLVLATGSLGISQPSGWASIPKQGKSGPDYGRVGEQAIRVRIAEAAPAARISGHALSFGGPSGGAARSLASLSYSADSEVWELRCQDDRVRAVRVGGGPGRTVDLASPAEIRSASGFIQFQDRPYREAVRVYAAGSLCEVINELSVEKYLSGLVNAEFSSRWNEEAVAAQVVAARSYALYQIDHARRQRLHFDVDATVSDQVYDGSIREDARAERVVQKTRGIALTVGTPASPAPIKAFYHSTCAGRTELPEHVWGRSYPGFRQGVACPFCARSPVMNWSLELSPDELARVIRRGAAGDGTLPASLQGLRGTELLSLSIGRMGLEGRVAQLISRWRMPSGQVREWSFSGARLRDWIGPARFRSAAFSVAQAGFFRFEGRGNGHGVGLCQYGAKGMGEKGYSMVAILKHYYPDAVLRRLW